MTGHLLIFIMKKINNYNINVAKFKGVSGSIERHIVKACFSGGIITGSRMSLDVSDPGSQAATLMWSNYRTLRS